MRILLLIRSLEIGGAEGQMALLAEGLRRAGHSVAMGVLYSGGQFEGALQRAGVPIICLGKAGRYDFGGVVRRLARAIRDEGIEVIYSALTAANILAVAAGVLASRVHVVWSLRASNVDLRRYERWIRLTAFLERRLARFSDRIVVNSRAGLHHATATGYPRDKMTVVLNGIDTSRFRPDHDGRDRLRAEWGVQPTQQLVGLVARLDPMKDHPSFLAAAARLGKRDEKLRFVCIGDGAKGYGASLRALAGSLGLEDVVIWAGSHADMPAVYSAMDLLVQSSSFGEGLPNAVAEAMACGIPCVVTDVGDAAWLVGERGIVVPPASPALLADGIKKALRQPPTSAERSALRARVVENLGLDRLIRETEAVFRSVVPAR